MASKDFTNQLKSPIYIHEATEIFLAHSIASRTVISAPYTAATAAITCNFIKLSQMLWIKSQNHINQT